MATWRVWLVSGLIAWNIMVLLTGANRPVVTSMSTLGMVLNMLVLLANGMHMPVTTRANYFSGEHIPAIGTRLTWLGDHIPIGIGYASIGDMLIFGAILLLIGSIVL